MPKPILNPARVMPGIRQGVAAAVSQHVRVHRERKPGALADALDKAVHRVGGERAAALRGEHKGAVRECRCSSRRARISSPRKGCAAGLPFLARRTCSVAARPISTCDHSRSQISTALRPCRYATGSAWRLDDRSGPCGRLRSASRPRQGSDIRAAAARHWPACARN